MSPRAGAILVACCLIGAVAPACTGGGTNVPTPTPESRISIQPDDPSLPYGIVAINYHFHDAHPSRPLLPTRTVVFSNQSTLKHNVTFPQFDFSKDFRPGQTITIEDLGQKLGGPGVYSFFCRYHASLGMIGTVIVT
jgi:Cupredoxin-like domain